VDVDGADAEKIGLIFESKFAMLEVKYGMVSGCTPLALTATDRFDDRAAWPSRLGLITPG
jgi:hypothetical protein